MFIYLKFLGLKGEEKLGSALACTTDIGLEVVTRRSRTNSNGYLSSTPLDPAPLEKTE